MANDFIYNLRAARAGQNSNITQNRLPTRGDIQKQRAAENKKNEGTGSLFNNLPDIIRQALGIYKLPPKPEEPGFSNHADQAPPDSMYEKTWEDAQKEGMAVNGSLWARGNGDYIPPAGMYADEGYHWFMNDDIYNNYDKLMQIIDEYDRAVDGKSSLNPKAALDPSINKLPNNNNLNFWIDVFARWDDMALKYGSDRHRVSDMMRLITENTRNNLYRKV